METTLFELTFLDGRIFRVFCYGRSQKQRFQKKVNALEGVKSIKELSNGIHTIKEFEKLILSHRIAYGNNPVLNWMAHNIVAVTDPANNQKPDKSHSREKIDGIVALIMALDRATRHEGDSGSVFGTGEMIIL